VANPLNQCSAFEQQNAAGQHCVRLGEKRGQRGWGEIGDSTPGGAKPNCQCLSRYPIDWWQCRVGRSLNHRYNIVFAFQINRRNEKPCILTYVRASLARAWREE